MQTKVKRKERPPFSGCRVPLPRPLAGSRLVPTSHTASEPSPAPLVRTRRSTTGRTAAPPVRVSTNRPRRATSAGTSEEEGSASLFEERQRAQREHLRREESAPRACPPFMERGSALRSAPFWLHLPSGSFPKRGVPHSDRVTPRVHHSGASRPTPLLSHSSEKQAGELGGRILGGKSRT